jgi:toxin ParE1/3/4
MSANYQFSQKADEDLFQIFRYTLRTFGRSKAEQYYQSIIQSVKTAATFPELGRSYETHSGKIYRRYNIGRHVLFFEVEGDGIFIVRILHDRMDYETHL